MGLLSEGGQKKKTQTRQLKFRSAFFHPFRYLPDWQLWMQGAMRVLCHATMVT